MPETKIQFSEARNGEKTCSSGGKFLHSKYNPTAEAQKFVDAIESDFEPQCVFVLEPALSYCAQFLRKRFPKSSVCAIRFTREFSENDRLWDETFDATEELDDDLFNAFGEEKICSSIFVDWTASKNAFPEKSETAWLMIRNAVVKSRNVMATRSFFAKRWLKNSAIFAAYVENTTAMRNEEKTSFPILIAASGSSLKTSIEKIRENRSRFFLMAVSSAFMPLFDNGIEADFVVSTDGGYWAKKHLEFPSSKNSGTTFALALEGAAPARILREKSILPLLYDDATDFQRRIMERQGIKTAKARRNGTVSGTALELAMDMTDGPIFLCGLDQAPCGGYQHTQPNALESAAESADNRLSTKETRMTASKFNSEKSLEIYRNWFVSNSQRFNSPKERIFRLSANFKFEFPLGMIRDIDWDGFERLVPKNDRDTGKGRSSGIFMDTPKKNGKALPERRRIIQEELERSLSDEKFLSEVFPLETLLMKREKDFGKRNAAEQALEEKKRKLVSEIGRTLKTSSQS
ncbi:MAG: DUF115 domain-containing protein [Treponema sp.]|nr:DUF115 domain-containing protein [Treponema sp.]